MGASWRILEPEVARVADQAEYGGPIAHQPIPTFYTIFISEVAYIALDSVLGVEIFLLRIHLRQPLTISSG